MDLRARSLDSVETSDKSCCVARRCLAIFLLSTALSEDHARRLDTAHQESRFGTSYEGLPQF
jgi:hypothetical protein